MLGRGRLGDGQCGPAPFSSATIASRVGSQEKSNMHARIPRVLIPALLAATIPASAVLAQAPPQPSQPQAPQAQERQGRPERLSPEVRARLQDGRIAMI